METASLDHTRKAVRSLTPVSSLAAMKGGVCKAKMLLAGAPLPLRGCLRELGGFARYPDFERPNPPQTSASASPSYARARCVAIV